MARINLLPWRDRQREARHQQFMWLLVGIAVAGTGLIALGERVLDRAIEQQASRNAYLGTRIASLEERIRQISDLQARREQLLVRLQIIQGLQGNRPASVRLFDQLARVLPNGVYFTELGRVGKTLSISGVAESNGQVSELLRSLAAAGDLAVPVLEEVKVASAGDEDPASVFRLTVAQAQADAEA
jgi:type IV pilus assembly protein PilN